MLDRRQFLTATISAASGMALANLPSVGFDAKNVASSVLINSVLASGPHASDPNGLKTNGIAIALNTSTIRGQKLSIEEQIEVTAKAGYDGIEPWIRDLQAYRNQGGSIEKLAAKIEDAGLKVVSAIGFGQWIVEDEAARAKGLEDSKRDMQLVHDLGGTRIAAPPIGAHRSNQPQPTLDEISDRYRALCEVGQSVGVAPQLELWGFSPTLSKLSELAYVATAASHPMACVLPDFYHIYKGGNDFEGLRMIEASKMHCFHINDYPAEPSREAIADKDRVFPGDGVCDLQNNISKLIQDGFQGTFSLELFNPDYWKRDALEVASEGLRKSKAVIDRAIAAVHSKS